MYLKLKLPSQISLPDWDVESGKERTSVPADMFLTHVASLHSLGTEGYPAQFEQVLLRIFYLMIHLPSILLLILLLFLLLLVLLLLILLLLFLLLLIILLLILWPLILWLLILLLLIPGS